MHLDLQISPMPVFERFEESLKTMWFSISDITQALILIVLSVQFPGQQARAFAH
mgnify:CR=1 FL=1